MQLVTVWTGIGAVATIGVALAAAASWRTASVLARIEKARRRTELTPRFELAFSWLPGDPQTDVQVFLRLIGPTEVNHVDSLSLISRAVPQGPSGQVYPTYVFKTVPYPSLRPPDITKEEARQGWTLSQPPAKLHAIVMSLTPHHLPEYTDPPLGEYVARFEFELRTSLAGTGEWVIYGEFDMGGLKGLSDTQQIVIP